MATKKKHRQKKSKDRTAHVIPGPLPRPLLTELVIDRSLVGERDVISYLAGQAPDETVEHVEKIKSEHLWDVEIDCWDVWTDKARWWVLTNPTNLYSQEAFQSLDYTISFHVGIRIRMMSRRSGPDADMPHPLDEVWRRLKQAGEALDGAKEAEDFQTVGMRCRECLLALVRAYAIDIEIPPGMERPKAADFIHWTELIADAKAHGESAKEVRSHLKALAKSTWQLVAWLTHAKNAVRYDARMAQEATEYLVSSFHNAHTRQESGAPDRCPNCSSYRIVSDFRPDLEIDPPYVAVCESCGWNDFDSKKPDAQQNP